MEFRAITPDTEHYIDAIFAGPTAQYWVHYNRYWYEKAAEKADIEARLIYVEGEKQPVGFIAYGQHYRDEALTDASAATYEVIHLVIDEPHQRRGYGRQATRKAIAILRALPGCHAIVIAHHPDNVAARQLYRSLGFVPVGTNYDGDPLLELRPATG